MFQDCIDQAADELLALPASSGQQRFWVLDQIKPGDPSCNVAVRFGLTGILDRVSLEAALNEIIGRHEILRANFVMLDGQVMQLVSPARKIDIQFTDITALPESERALEADRLAGEEAQRPFNLASGPLMRAGLLRLADDEHVLLITIHHIVSDGWSIGILTGELGAIYEAFHAGLPSPLPELPIQYADYTLWQRDHRNELASTEDEAYWKNKLSDLPQFEVTPDMPRNAAKPAIGNILSRLLPVALTDSFRELSRRQDSTLFVTMLAALATLLYRYTGETDIVVGSPVAGRNSMDVEPLIGPFINTLVLRTDTSGDPTFLELLERVRHVVCEALAHQELPFDRVAELLRLNRSAERNLLFQINCIYQRDFVKPWEHAGLRMRPIPSKSPGAMHDLNIFLVERNDGWRVSCEYNTALFFESTVSRMLEHFEILLQAILADPSRPIGAYAFLGEDESRQILLEWNRTHTDYPRNSSAIELIEKQARRTPDAVAVIFEGCVITYRELNSRASQLAGYLKQRGAGVGSLIGICLPRSIEMLTAVLAVWKAGAAYVPLDPSFPAARLSFMAADAAVKLVVTDRTLANLISTTAAKILVDDARATVEQTDLTSAAGPLDIAYVIYTSGSTGKPKGVAVQHRALVNLLCAAIAQPGITSKDSLAAVTTLSFDIAGLELFAPLVAGARIVLASHDQSTDGIALRKLLVESRATILQATPATWRMLVDCGWGKAPQLKMLCGGEPLSRELADALLDRGGELWNMYGPTETTIWSSWQQIRRDGMAPSIGRPAANTLFYVLDSHRQPVPVGVRGELYIGGDGVAQGYLNRPELNAERFLTNPFANGRMYRTGDRARWRPDGTVELLGRMDTQVKIRGHRIELGEVEAALAACPAVRNAAVIVREDASGEKILVGYFVPSQDTHAAADAVRQHLKQRLPDYMAPTHLVALPALPQTPNGKLDRNALPAPETVRIQIQPPIETPHDSIETKLIAIWEKVLGVRPLQRTDNFFDIGGHSLLAAKMLARIEKEFGKLLPLATLFQAPTVAELANLIRHSGWKATWSSLVPIRPSGTKPPFYFVHAIGGNVLNFASFAGHFDPDQPVYGLQARGLDGKEIPNMSVHQMAADYIQDIRNIQPEGPYCIGGFSAGGVVAFEMARQLRAAGQQVAILALLDSRIDNPNQSGVAASKERFTRTVAFNIRYAFHTGLLSFARQKLKNLRMRANIRIWTIKNSLGFKPSARTLDVEEAFLLALRNYVPETYGGDASLFRAKDELCSYSDPTLGWGSVVKGRLEILEISGDHDTILHEPHIGMLARVLNSCLDAVQAAGRNMLQRSA
ncbi:MAG TPA: amino acid adenylation domain-containing protein [Bryobacteraceae bacterium]